MVEFVANYRRSANINGKLSYSNLYTSISVLAGHYASYGPKFPVPEKRRKRLLQVEYLYFCVKPKWGSRVFLTNFGLASDKNYLTLRTNSSIQSIIARTLREFFSSGGRFFLF